jgi:hypothetical protein
LQAQSLKKDRWHLMVPEAFILYMLSGVDVLPAIDLGEHFCYPP